MSANVSNIKTAPESTTCSSGKTSTDRAATEIENDAEWRDTAVFEHISVWLKQHGIAWSGTTSELAAAIGREPEEVLHAMANAKASLIFGIAASVSRNSGGPRVIRIDLMKTSEANAPLEFPVISDKSHDDGTVQRLDLPLPSLLGLSETDDRQPSSINAVPEKENVAAQLYTSATRPGRKTLIVMMLIAIAIAALSSKQWLRKSVSHRTRSIMPVAQMRTSTTHSVEVNPTPERPRFELEKNDLVQLFRESEEGNATAQYALAARFLAGDGLKPDALAATGWFQKAAQSGNRDAQFQLGLSYMLGRGCEKDDVLAYTWFTLSSINGQAQAESMVRKLTPELSRAQIGQVRYTLAEMYQKGIGVPVDKITAYVWYVLSAAAGQDKSEIAKEELASEMTKSQVVEATVRASRWLRGHQL